jgi:hypothetical protein
MQQSGAASDDFIGPGHDATHVVNAGVAKPAEEMSRLVAARATGAIDNNRLVLRFFYSSLKKPKS